MFSAVVIAVRCRGWCWLAVVPYWAAWRSKRYCCQRLRIAGWLTWLAVLAPLAEPVIAAFTSAPSYSMKRRAPFNEIAWLRAFVPLLRAIRKFMVGCECWQKPSDLMTQTGSRRLRAISDIIFRSNYEMV